MSQNLRLWRKNLHYRLRRAIYSRTWRETLINRFIGSSWSEKIVLIPLLAFRDRSTLLERLSRHFLLLVVGISLLEGWEIGACLWIERGRIPELGQVSNKSSTPRRSISVTQSVISDRIVFGFSTSLHPLDWNEVNRSEKRTITETCWMLRCTPIALPLNRTGVQSNYRASVKQANWKKMFITNKQQEEQIEVLSFSLGSHGFNIWVALRSRVCCDAPLAPVSYNSVAYGSGVSCVTVSGEKSFQRLVVGLNSKQPKVKVFSNFHHAVM